MIAFVNFSAQQLIGNEPRSMHDMMQVVRKVSYLGVGKSIF